MGTKLFIISQVKRKASQSVIRGIPRPALRLHKVLVPANTNVSAPFRILFSDILTCVAHPTLQQMLILRGPRMRPGFAGQLRDAVANGFNKKVHFLYHRPTTTTTTTPGLWTALYAPLLIPKINSSAHLCPSNTTLTPTAGGILLEKMPLSGPAVKHQFDLFHLGPSSLLLSHPTDSNTSRRAAAQQRRRGGTCRTLASRRWVIQSDEDPSLS